MASELRRVSGLWLKDGRSGKFMSGETDEEIPAGSRLLVFKNTKKVEGDKLPDYILHVAPDNAESTQRPRQSGTSGQSRQSTEAQDRPPLTDDQIPF